MRTTILALALAVLVSCGGSESGPVLTMNGDTGGPVADALDDEKEICTPHCEGKTCGPDGCNGECGTCKFQIETCTDEGQCIPTPCDSTKDCPGDLVCDKEQGICVVCVGDEDCPEGKICGADHECHEECPCDSDIDCKDKNMVCDKEAGKCVECLGPEECPEEQYCLETYCVDDICTAGESHCDGLDVVTCNEEGSAEAVTEICTDTQYCEDGECLDLPCTPDEQWCEFDIAKKCASDGKSVESETDCAETDSFCLDGVCQKCFCMPGATFCLGDFTVVECADNCVDAFETPCGAEESCAGGVCVSWLCDPSSVFCDGDVYKECSGNGLSIQYHEDCGAKEQHCFNGACIETECPPNKDFCEDDSTVMAHCAEDGMDYTTEPCPAEHYCDDGDDGVQCLPWVCTPGEASCEDNTAKVCNGKGSAVANEIDCGDSFCMAGECVNCIPQCSGKDCGEDGCGDSCGECPANVLCLAGQCTGCDDGNNIPWDGCTDGEVTEFGVNEYSAQDQKDPSVAVADDGGFIITWRGHGGQGNVLGVYARLFDALGAPLGGDVEVASQQEVIYGAPRATALSGGKYAVIWQESPSQGGCCDSVAGQLVGEEGDLLGPPLQVNTTADSGLFGVDVSATQSAGFVAAWAGTSGAEYSLRYQRFDSAGVKVGSEITLSKGKRPVLAGVDEGSFVIAFNHNSGSGVFVSRVSANDELLGDTLAVDVEGSLQAVCDGPDSLYAVAWNKAPTAENPVTIGTKVYSLGSDDPDIELAVFSEFPASSHLSVTVALDGALVVAWSGNGENTDSLDVFLQCYDGNGGELGNQQLVHSFTSGWQTHQDSAVFTDGSFIIAWDSDDQDGSGKGIYAQRFDASGNKVYR